MEKMCDNWTNRVNEKLISKYINRLNISLPARGLKFDKFLIVMLSTKWPSIKSMHKDPTLVNYFVASQYSLFHSFQLNNDVQKA